MIAALHPCSFIDYPGELAIVLFTQGCNLRCRYCHNPQLCPPTGPSHVPLDEVNRLLASRRGRISAVTVTGGEPTLHEKLPTLLRAARSLGYSVKLDTNGMRPTVVRDLVRSGLLTYVAVDVKAAPGSDASWLTGAARQGELAIETLGHVVAAGVACEARTTVVRACHDRVRLAHTARCLAATGVRTWRLQPVVDMVMLDESLPCGSPGESVLSCAVEEARALGLDAAVRRGHTPIFTLSNSNEIATAT